MSRDIGNHGACILMARDALQLGSDLKRLHPLWPQVEALLQRVLPSRPCATPPAVALPLCSTSGLRLRCCHRAGGPPFRCVRSGAWPVRSSTVSRPHDLANAGTMVLALPAEQAQDALGILRSFPAASQIGVVQASDRHKVILSSPGAAAVIWSCRRELLPPIC